MRPGRKQVVHHHRTRRVRPVVPHIDRERHLVADIDSRLVDGLLHHDVGGGHEQVGEVDVVLEIRVGLIQTEHGDDVAVPSRILHLDDDGQRARGSVGQIADIPQARDRVERADRHVDAHDDGGGHQGVEGDHSRRIVRSVVGDRRPCR